MNTANRYFFIGLLLVSDGDIDNDNALSFNSQAVLENFFF